MRPKSNRYQASTTGPRLKYSLRSTGSPAEDGNVNSGARSPTLRLRLLGIRPLVCEIGRQDDRVTDAQGVQQDQGVRMTESPTRRACSKRRSGNSARSAVSVCGRCASANTTPQSGKRAQLSAASDVLKSHQSSVTTSAGVGTPASRGPNSDDWTNVRLSRVPPGKPLRSTRRCSS